MFLLSPLLNPANRFAPHKALSSWPLPAIVFSQQKWPNLESILWKANSAIAQQRCAHFHWLKSWWTDSVGVSVVRHTSQVSFKCEEEKIDPRKRIVKMKGFYREVCKSWKQKDGLLIHPVNHSVRVAIMDKKVCFFIYCIQSFCLFLSESFCAEVSTLFTILPHLSHSNEQMGRKTRAAGWEQQAKSCIHHKQGWLPGCRFISPQGWKKMEK